MQGPAGTPSNLALADRLGSASAGAALVAASLSLASVRCLPGDTRPVPETLYVTAEPSQALTLGIETSDGWRISFDRLLMGVGNVDFEEDDASCNSYAEARYSRLFDFTVAGREKVGTIYGLGTCRVEFRLREPAYDALLGPGATAADLEFMRLRGTDGFADDQRASVLAVGEGTRGDMTKRFAWVFRRSYEITSCEAEGGGFATTVELTEGGAGELRIEVRGEELFRSVADDAADLRFQPIADADADADGTVTLDELLEAPQPVDTGEPVPGGGEELSHAHLIYLELLPRLLRVAGGGPCEAEQRSRR